MIFIFRECFFEYAGRYSGDYNLILAYVDNSNVDFTSGGIYEPTTETLPSSAESILYSLNYSENPIEFSVEIVNTDEAIPFEQMIEIKNWLFGQDGWKRLKIEDSNYKDYYLNCLLIPDADIVDGTGYRGVRCTVKNMSAFWYRDEVFSLSSSFFENEYDNRDSEGFITFDMEVKGENPGYISPIIEFGIPQSGTEATSDWPYHKFVMHNCSEEKDARHPDSQMELLLTYGQKGKQISIDSRYGTYEIDNVTECIRTGSDTPAYDWFYLVKGNNKIKVNMVSQYHNKFVYNGFTIRYVGMYRIGGF